MEPTISNAVFLLAIGMITVFSILTLVILTGRVLISIANKYFPEAASKESAHKDHQVSDQTLQVINATIKKITNSKGVVENIKKI